MTLPPLVFLPFMGIGGAFFPVEDCTLASAKALDTDSVERHVIACTEGPYLGKAPIGVSYEILASTTPQAWPASLSIQAAAGGSPGRAAYSHETSPFVAVREGLAAVTGPDRAPPAPIPLPVTVWLLGSALFGLWFWGSVIRWVLS